MIRASDKRPWYRTELSYRKRPVISRCVYLLDTPRCNFTLLGEKLDIATTSTPTMYLLEKRWPTQVHHTRQSSYTVLWRLEFSHPCICERFTVLLMYVIPAPTHHDFYRAVFVQGDLSHEQNVRLSVRPSVCQTR